MQRTKINKKPIGKHLYDIIIMDEPTTEISIEQIDKAKKWVDKTIQKRLKDATDDNK